jgi:PHP family Zn ribbon phosphoesterase
MNRHCTDCGHRYTISPGPWLDVLLCPNCGGDDTVGVEPSLEDELAALAGEAVNGNGRP